MLTSFLLPNTDKTKVLVLGPHSVGDRLFDYIVTLDGIFRSPCAEVNDLGVIITPVSHSKLM